MGFLLYVPVLGWTQAADELEALLAAPRVSYAQAARLVLEAADTAALSDPTEAFRYAKERDWLPKKAGANEAARLDGISLLLMRAFDIKGGFHYTHFKNAHFAYRELMYKKVIIDRSDPAMPVSGDLLLFITGRVMSLRATAGRSLLEG